MTPAQCRRARNLLGWSQVRLGVMSGTAEQLIVTFERDGRVRAASICNSPNPLEDLRTALETAGVEFIDNDTGPGVKLRKPDQ